MELPPLKLASDPTVADAKKKPTLPLFGKKRTFGFGKPAPKAIKIDDSSQHKNVEEFDDDDDDDEGGDSGDTKARESTSESTTKNAEDEVSKRPTSPEELDKKEKEKSVEMDVSVQSSSSEMLPDDVKSVEKSVTNSNDEATSDAREPAETTASCKRKRNRYRNRGEKGRGNIDIDYIEEPLESEKYSKWVPPQNQSGDGITDLNSKYGY